MKDFEKRLEKAEKQIEDQFKLFTEITRDIDQLRSDMLRAGITLESVSGKLDYIIASRLDLSAGQQEAVAAGGGGGKRAAGDVIDWTERMRKAVFNMGVMFGIVAPDGTVLEARKGRYLHGNLGEPEWFVGRNIAEFGQPDQVQLAKAKLSEIVEKKQSGRFDLTIHVDGQSGLRKIRGWPMDDGNVFFITELPEKR